MSVEPQPRARRRRVDVIRAVLACGIALGLGSVGTLAQWTTGGSVQAGSIRAGQLDVVVNGHLATVANVDGTHVETSWKIDEMLPGEFVALTITATNAGASTMPLDLRVAGYVQGTLGPYLNFEFWEGGTVTGGTPWTSPAAATWRQASCAGGIPLTGWRTLGSTPAAPTPILTTKQRLNVGQSKTYCVLMALNGDAATYGNTALLGAKGTAVLVFRGTQDGAP